MDQATEVVRDLLMLLAGYGSSPVKFSLDNAYNTALEAETNIYICLLYTSDAADE